MAWILFGLGPLRYNFLPQNGPEGSILPLYFSCRKSDGLWERQKGLTSIVILLYTKYYLGSCLYVVLLYPYISQAYEIAVNVSIKSMKKWSLREVKYLD